MDVAWAALLIPAITGVCLRYIWEHRVTWWEIALPMLPVLIVIPCVKFSAERFQTNDYERHGGRCVEARYFEAWNEWKKRTCSRNVGSGKNRRTEYYDCSYVEYHAPYWELTDSNGYVVSIKQDQFEGLCKKFGNRKFIDMHRHYHTIDGDQYATRWTGTEESYQPVVTEHRYENRVQASHGVLSYPDLTPHQVKETGLFDYPSLLNHLDDPAILGACPGSNEADRYLQIQNAKLGKSKEVRFWILLFHEKPRSVGFDQESFWKGGNKNEVVVSIGLNKESNADWCYVFCWSPDGNTTNDMMKINIRDFIEQQKPFDIMKSAEFIVSEVKERFKRKDFEEFSYLAVETPQWAVILIYVLTILTTSGVGYYVVVNDIQEKGNEQGAITRRYHQKDSQSRRRDSAAGN